MALAFKLTLAREPRPQETELTLAHMAKVEQRYLDLKTPPEQAAKKALTGVCQMLLATNEFLYID